MREHPWSLRRPSHEHYRWFNNLLDLHWLTREWIKDLSLRENDPSHHLKRAITSGLGETYAVLEKITETSVPPELDLILDEMLPEELLQRLEHLIWVIQSWSVHNILSHTSKDERTAVFHALQQTAWTVGRQCADRRWKNLEPAAREDLRALSSILQDSPLAKASRSHGFLVVRSTEEELILQLLQCPHRSKYYEVRPVADELCELHFHWIRGFTYGIHTRLHCEYVPRMIDPEAPEKSSQSYCQLRLSFSSPEALAFPASDILYEN